MQIEIKLLASLRTGRFKAEVREYPSATEIREVVADLGIPEKGVGVALRNGQHTNLDVPLNDGDALTLLPLIGGG